jgi:hypothetical protein
MDIIFDLITDGLDAVGDFWGSLCESAENLFSGGAETATEVVDNTQMSHHIPFPEETSSGSNISFGSRELRDCKWEIDKIEREMKFETGEKYEKLKKMRDELIKTAKEYVRSDGYAKNNMFNATWNAAHRK